VIAGKNNNIKINNMDKKLVEAFVAEIKQMKMLNEMYKANIIEFDNYFKYSGKTEPPKLKVETVSTTPMIYKVSKYDHMVIDYYFKNSDTKLTTIAEDLGINVSLVRKILNNYFDNLKHNKK